MWDNTRMSKAESSIADLGLADPSRVVEIVPASGIAWEATGNANEVATWLGNTMEVDRQAILLATRQAAAEGNVLRISFPSVMTFMLGYDFTTRRYTCAV